MTHSPCAASRKTRTVLRESRYTLSENAVSLASRGQFCIIESGEQEKSSEVDGDERGGGEEEREKT